MGYLPIHRLPDPFGETTQDYRRSSGRRLQEELRSSLGPVIDLSRGGMQVVARTELEGEVEVTLTWYEGQLTLKAEVAWSRQAGRRKFEIGLRFLDVDADKAHQLMTISTAHQLRREESD